MRWKVFLQLPLAGVKAGQCGRSTGAFRGPVYSEQPRLIISILPPDQRQLLHGDEPAHWCWGSRCRHHLWRIDNHNATLNHSQCKRNPGSMEGSLAIFGPESIWRSFIIGTSPIGAEMTVVGLEEDGMGILGNVILLWGTGWKWSRWRPCISAGEAGGSSENSCALDLSDGWILGWVTSCEELKLSCLFGTEHPFLLSPSVLFEADGSLFLSLCCRDSIAAGSAVCSTWVGGQCGATEWARGWRSWSNFRPRTWAVGSLCVISLDGGNTGALWLGSVVARRPCDVGINLLLPPNWISGDTAWTDSGCRSCRKTNSSQFGFTVIWMLFTSKDNVLWVIPDKLCLHH